MKRILLLVLLSLPLLVSAQQGEFTLNGSISHLEKPSKVYLNYLSDGESVLDSAITDQGRFIFKGKIGEPVLAKITLDPGGEGAEKTGVKGEAGFTGDILEELDQRTDHVLLYLEPGQFSVTAKDSIKYAVIKGSKLNEEYHAYLKYIARPRAAVAAVLRKFVYASAEKKQDDDFNFLIETEYDMSFAKLKSCQLTYIKAHPDSYFSLVALTEPYLNEKLNLQELAPLYQGLSARVRATTLGVMIAKAIEDAH